MRNVVIIGSGCAGLTAAVYAARANLQPLVIRGVHAGGQLTLTTLVENYPGFPKGVQGPELIERMHEQATEFGAEFMAGNVTKVDLSQRPFVLEVHAERVETSTLIIASGAKYRKLELENLTRFEGAGVYYAATKMEAQVCDNQEVIVVGGGNSAGQAAVFLSQSMKHVYVLVRSDGLAATMSRYLIRRIEETPNITLRTQTEIVGLEGKTHLEAVSLKNSATGEVERRPIRHVFSMTGAVPSTEWLAGCVVLDEKGFVKTGPDISPEERDAVKWPRARAPLLLETSLPGVFAVGDARMSNVKRVASAVGEGSICVQLVHRVLAE